VRADCANVEKDSRFRTGAIVLYKSHVVPVQIDRLGSVWRQAGVASLVELLDLVAMNLMFIVESVD
jgi:hypothetical protein